MLSSKSAVRACAAALCASRGRVQAPKTARPGAAPPRPDALPAAPQTVITQSRETKHAVVSVGFLSIS